MTPLNKFKHRFFLEFVTKNFSRGLDAARDASRSRYIIPSLFLLGRSGSLRSSIEANVWHLTRGASSRGAYKGNRSAVDPEHGVSRSIHPAWIASTTLEETYIFFHLSLPLSLLYSFSRTLDIATWIDLNSVEAPLMGQRVLISIGKFARSWNFFRSSKWMFFRDRSMILAILHVGVCTSITAISEPIWPRADTL